MTITDAHNLVAGAAGEMSFAIVKREAPPAQVMRWVAALRRAADGLERRAASQEIQA